MVDLTTIEKLRFQSSIIRGQIIEQINQMNYYGDLAHILETQIDNLKPEKILDIENIANDLELQWLEQKLKERQKMKDRGENVSVPDSPIALKNELLNSKG